MVAEAQTVEEFEAVQAALEASAGTDVGLQDGNGHGSAATPSEGTGVVPPPCEEASSSGVLDTAPQNSRGTAEHRKKVRYSFRWKGALAIGGKIHQCHTIDLSIGGAMVALPKNLFAGGCEFVFHLLIPPTTFGDRPQPIQVTARMAYTILSGEHQCFVGGIQFMRFSDNGKAVLEAALEERRT